MRRADIAASSIVFLRNGASSRSPTPTRPVGENTIKATNTRSEPEQPVLGIDAEEFAEQDEEQRAERGPPGNCACRRSRPSPAGSPENDTEIGSAEVIAVLVQQENAGKPGDAGRPARTPGACSGWSDSRESVRVARSQRIATKTLPTVELWNRHSRISTANATSATSQ